MATYVYPEKHQTEELLVHIDFSSRCIPGESVATAVVSCDVFSGIDPNPAATISGSPTISGNIVSQKMVGGLPGVIYLLYFSVRTTSNNIVVNEVKVAVLSSNAPTPP